jgi:anti-anti-sigma factor
MSIDVAVGTPVRMKLSGELDVRTTPILRKALVALSHDDLVIDCRELAFLDSTGISLLAEVHRTRELDGRAMTLRNVSGAARRTLEICGLLETLSRTP